MLTHGQRLADASDRAGAGRGGVKGGAPVAVGGAGKGAEALVDLLALAGGAKILDCGSPAHEQFKFVAAIATDILENWHGTNNLLKVALATAPCGR